MSQPDADGCELDEGEVVGRVFLVAGGDRAIVLKLLEEAGQVSGVTRMIEDDRYCLDILTQIHAGRAALHKVEEQILRDHVAHCVADAFSSGDVRDQQQKVEELVGAIGRMTR